MTGSSYDSGQGKILARDMTVEKDLKDVKLRQEYPLTTREAFRGSKADFYLNGKLVGENISIPQMTSHDDRVRIANEAGIPAFDKVVMDHGRVIITRVKRIDDHYYTDQHGRIWMFSSLFV